MSENKKPDSVVYDSESGTYNAALLPYASGVGAPRITTPDITSWKQNNINKVNHEIKSQFDQLKAEYDAMVKKFDDNQLVYGAKFSFEPIVGETYHLYQGKDVVFLSVISPQECRWDFLGTYRLTSEKLWEEIK
ncbi:DUF2452 domain-containing protein [Nonlabens antarcticus]|uniref:DUF2452 domain-containing protein n=1 Tax=Nonlabens antarcticus TaxID=392714 RepID=UPI001891335B|nr:DUF2452 domain-containing protein [Nonlabens antarcticus]